MPLTSSSKAITRKSSFDKTAGITTRLFLMFTLMLFRQLFTIITDKDIMVRKQNGFTIVELVITIVFLGFVVLGISQLYVSIQRIQEQTAYLQAASHAAQTEVESLRNDNYNALTAGQNIDFTAQLPTTLPTPRTGTVVVSEPQAGLKRVDVTITYTEHTHQHKVALTSLIGVIGISQ